ncbi:LpqB family beta-propeller domain-containing protein [Kitasatospora sp. NPDC002040]|uniref:LpqB family beta-propeller domain-containing protein n=1 Tax=Kitasatospora sp. NPDC002040 TaxID=3154661 RepID=UPI00331CB93A
MPRTDRTDRRAKAAFGAVVVSLFTAGCVAMPSDGPPERVELPLAGGSENLQVRVFPVGPHVGDGPDSLLAGFLDAANADEALYSTASDYLTAAAVKRWKPEEGVVVLRSTPQRTVGSVDEGRAEVRVTGEQVAVLDAKRTYRAVSGAPFEKQFTFVKETEGKNKGQWRIDQLPDGLIIDQTKFKNGYRAVHLYYPSAADPWADRPQNPVLVPDPVFLRRRIDPFTSAAKALVEGPSGWLAKAVDRVFDDSTRIRDGVTVSENGVATVKVTVPDFGGRQPLCQQMAAQLFHTLSDLQGKSQLQRLDLVGDRGGCQTDATRTAQIAPGALAGGGAGTQQYYLLENAQLVQAPDDLAGQAKGAPVPGALGLARTPRPADFAVRRDGTEAALVSADGRSLSVTRIAADTEKLGAWIPISQAAQPEQGLASPSWDGRGSLWVVDRNPAAPRVLVVRGQTVVPVGIAGLHGRTVRSLKVSSDGTRIALVVTEPNRPQTLMIGLIGHGGTPAEPTATVSELRPVGTVLSEVVSVSWADTDQLLVLGKEDGKLQQLHYFGTDGSVSSDFVLQGGDSMTSVSATEARGPQLDKAPSVLATSGQQQIYRLVGNQWREVQGKPKAWSFSYPG